MFVPIEKVGLCVAIGVALLVTALPDRAAAQATGTIRGTVVEAGTQRPLPAVHVFIKGTARGRSTDRNGAFAITDVPAGAVTLRVESIGYRSTEQTVTVSAGAAATVNFEMEGSAVGLDEIVVTGTAMGTAKRALGNSISQVKASEITESASVKNVQELLQGRAPGVVMSSSSGVVGGSSRTRIRGLSSLNAGNEPVVYVDGVRVQSGTLGTSGNTAQGVNLLEAFNPNDIESIEVIKGPAAATLYGAEAATGVIQIITKKGRQAEGLVWSANIERGEVEWAVDQIETYWLCTDARMANLNSNPGCSVFSASQPLAERLLVDRPLDASGRSLAVRDQYAKAATAARAAGNERLAREYESGGYPCLYPEQAPCEPEPLRKGTSENYNLSVRGGGEAYNFYISGERLAENGTFFNNFNNRTGGRANFGFLPSEKANFNVNVGYAVVDQKVPQSDNSSNSVLRNSYRGQAGGPNSQYLPGFRNFMPEFSNKYDRTVSQERLTMGVTANYAPLTWWRNRLTVGLDRSGRENNSFTQIDQTGLRPFGATAATGAIDIDYNNVYLWTLDYMSGLTHDLTSEVTSSFTGGMQMSKRRSESSNINGSGLVANSLNLVSSAANRSAGQGFSEQTSLGFFVEEQVGWRDRLFATAAVRVDDNSAFGRDFSLVVYPKASLSYVISEEPFFNVDFVDELKLRMAWGQAGNAPAPFSAERTYDTGRAVIDDQPVNTLGTDSYGNPDLKAETGSEIELGFDASVLNGRLGANFTLYHKTTKDALMRVDDPPSSGWTGTHLINVGEIKNSGMELTLDATVLSRPQFNWDVTAAIGTNNNELVTFGKDAQGNPVLLEDRFGSFASVQRHREGYPLGGLWATDVKRDASGLPILDANGVASVVDCPTWDPENPEVCEEEFLGSAFPTRSLGLTNTFRIMNNLQVNAFLDYQGGFYQWCAICSVRTRVDQNTAQINDPRLDPSDPEFQTYGKYELARLRSLQTKEFISRADFVKLREIGVTYTLPSRFVDRVGMSRASLTLSGRNLAVWTKYKGGSDPEVAFTSTNDFSAADYGSIPMQRRLVISTSFGF